MLKYFSHQPINIMHSWLQHCSTGLFSLVMMD